MSKKKKTRPPVVFEDLLAGCVYEIDYMDYDYPCQCSCHTGGCIHCVPCCYDNSYNGNATLIYISNSEELFFARQTYGLGKTFYLIPTHKVIRKSPEQEDAIELTEDIMIFAKNMLTNDKFEL